MQSELSPVHSGLSDVDATIFAFRRNVVVAASAGTGKTHRLTALYLLLTLGLSSMGQADDQSAAPPLGPEQIVATTFSRAAALEMSLRVERTLSDFAAWDGESELPFSSIVRAREAILGSRLPLGELRARAEAALSRWSSARIDTMHGIARRIALRHALALGLSPGARVLDEDEAQALADLAIDEALSEALRRGGEQAEVARTLIAATGSVNAARSKVRRLLDRIDEEGKSPLELTIADHAEDARALALRLLSIARACAERESGEARSAALALADALAPLERDPSAPWSLPDRAETALGALFERRVQRSSAPALATLIDELPGKKKSDRLASLLAFLRRAPELGVRERRIALLLEDARARLDAHKRREGALGFGDLLRIARDILRDQHELARAERESISALLVDEFQDTSRVQRDLVYLLRERDDAAIARPSGRAPGARDLQGHGLFLVGDRKQSIYGFRGADLAVFSQSCSELAGAAARDALAIAEDDAPTEPIAAFVALRESRRSDPAVLDFVNAYAARDFAGERSADRAPRSYEITYGPAEHLVPANVLETGASGEVVLIRDDSAKSDDSDPTGREARIAAAYVPTALGAPLGPERRRASYRDIAILTRKRSTIPLVELALARLDIPYVVAGRALYGASEIRDIAALLHLLLDPRDRLALATVLRGPMVALSDTSLAQLSVPGRGLSVPLLGPLPEPQADDPFSIDPDALDPLERQRLEGFRARFASFRGTALRLTPAEAIHASITAFDLDRVIATLPRGETRIGNLDRLVAIARRRGGTLASFVRWLDRRIRDDADEAEAAVFSADDDAVRITTIHASKGLDFPVVIVLDLNAEPRAETPGLGFFAERTNDTPTLVLRHFAERPGAKGELVTLATRTLREAQQEAIARERAERQRLSYVALTRARHALVLIAPAARPRPGSALQSLVSGLEEGDLAPFITRSLSAASLLAAANARAERVLVHASPTIRPPVRPKRPTTRSLTIAASALALFNDCPRRFHLRLLLGLEEPLSEQGTATDSLVDLPQPIALDPDMQPRPRVSPKLAQGIARFLEKVGVGDALIRRRDPFSLKVETHTRGLRELVLFGEVALVLEQSDNTTLLVNFAPDAPTSDLAPFELPLRAAALAASRRGASVRAGVVFLRNGLEPVWLPGKGPFGALSDEEHMAFERELVPLAQRFAEARHTGRFDGISPATCRQLGCGFLKACHAEKKRTE